jgi:hypothetical protein
MVPAMTATLQQLIAASALITTCEKILRSGVLPEGDEQNLRELIVKCCRAFEIAPLAECAVPASRPIVRRAHTEF